MTGDTRLAVIDVLAEALADLEPNRAPRSQAEELVRDLDLELARRGVVIASDAELADALHGLHLGCRGGTTSDGHRLDAKALRAQITHRRLHG